MKTQFHTTLRKANIENFRLHDSRHTFASYLIMNGVDLKTVSELLGHADTRMTERYSHLSPKHKARAVNILILPFELTQKLTQWKFQNQAGHSN